MNPSVASASRAVVVAAVAVIASCGRSPGAAVAAPPAAPRAARDRPPSGASVMLSPLIASLAPGATQRFTATVTGARDTGVRWSATGGAIAPDGTYTAPAAGGGYAIRATSAGDPDASAVAIVNVAADGAALEPFHDSAHPYVQLMTPMPHATYFAPATIRMWANAPDFGTDGVNNFSPRVEFYLGAAKVASVSIGPRDRVDDYEAQVTGVPAGAYELFVRSRMASGTVESMHVPITVIDLPPGGQAMTLVRDVVLRGDQSFELIGTAAARARLIGRNGARIRSAPGWTGQLRIVNADVIGLGAMDVPSIEVTIGGDRALDITGSVFDRCGPLSITANDRATVAIRGNTFQPNLLTPVNAEPDYAGSHPSLVFAGNSSARKLFQGNNVGVSFVRFDRSSHWLIGGDRDADGNVLLGVRAGIEIDAAADITIRGNLSYHRYPFGWSQGHNLDFEGDSADVLIEHNVFRDSSWMIQNPPGEFRYNLLVDNINEAFIRYSGRGARIHHNILVNTGYQRIYLPSGGVMFGDGSFDANTVDVGGARLGWFEHPFVSGDPRHRLASVRNNVFAGFAYRSATPVIAAGATGRADYNCFYNPDTALWTRYADPGLGAHDCGGGASTDPRFAQPRVVPFPVGDGDVWRRRITVSQILALYRGIYTPAPDSPLIDAGDPGDDTPGKRNTDIGAVGAGSPHPDDRFGRFGS